MAIEAGDWEYRSGNGMQVGIAVSRTNVTHASSSVSFTLKTYTRNQYSYSDNDEKLSFGGDWGSGSINFNNRQGDGWTLRNTRTVTHTYGSGSYGSSPGTRTFSASVSGAYNGVTPSASVRVTIPARPIAAPNSPTGHTASRNSDTLITSRWTNHSSPGRPYEWLAIQCSVDGGAWRRWQDTASAVSSRQLSGFAGNHQYRLRVRAHNDAGDSDWAVSGYVYTTPGKPTGAKAALQANGSVKVSWARHANYDVTYTVQRNVVGSGWVTRATGLTGAAWTDSTPGAGSRQYRVQAVAPSGLGSGWATTTAITTAPAAPTSVRATVQGTRIIVDWANKVVYGAYTCELQRRAGVGAWTTVATKLASGSTAWTDTNPGTGLNRYRVRAVGIGSQPSAWVESNSLSTNPLVIGSPGAPQGLAPDGQVVDAAQPVMMTWVHDPDAPPQTRRQVRYRIAGTDDDWTVGSGATPLTYREMPAGVVGDGVTLEWQVCTQGDPAAGLGPWSATATVTGARPKVWDGDTWVPHQLTVGDGDDWIPRPVLAGAGGQWT